jgi:hypothetical protein
MSAIGNAAAQDSTIDECGMNDERAGSQMQFSRYAGIEFDYTANECTGLDGVE